MGVGGQCHALTPLPPGKTQYPLYRRLGRPHSQSGQVQKWIYMYLTSGKGKGKIHPRTAHKGPEGE